MTTTNDEPDLSGLVLDDRYELVRRLGMGGMGSVYEARHVRIAKSVAIKVLHREYAYKESFRRRFLREAQAASLIRHKNVVAIHDFGYHEDVAYIVMDLLEGRDLHVLIHERAPLPWAEARSILLQTAAALGAAHERGVIHRDVKPANVFIADDPHDGMVVKVLDFGIARASTMAAEGGDQGATGSSRVFGTPTYMAPEIAFGEPADGRADLYSLGVVAYRVLTGHLPFEGDVPYLVISRHANEPPTPLRKIEPSIPVGVEQVVLKALAKRPGDRFQTMASFARALASIDARGRGEVPAALLQETEAKGRRASGAATPPADARSGAPASTTAGSGPKGPGASPTADTAIYGSDHEEPIQHVTGPSESSDVGTPVTDLGTERLPSRRRATGVSDVVEVHRAGLGERVQLEGEPSERLRLLEGRTENEPSGSMRAPLSGQVLVTSSSGPIVVVPAPRPWSGLWRVLGLLGLVAVAAAVGAIVARTQEPTGEPTTPTPSKAGDPVTDEPAAGRPTADPPTVEPEPTPTPEPGTTTDTAAGPDGGATGDDPSAETSSLGTEPVAPPSPPRPTGARKPSDARIKKKLAREIQRRCGAGAAGDRAVIEGIITAEGRVTGARVLEVSGEARSCIKGLVEAQRFPPGELRTLDLTVTL